MPDHAMLTLKSGHRIFFRTMPLHTRTNKMPIQISYTEINVDIPAFGLRHLSATGSEEAPKVRKWRLEGQNAVRNLVLICIWTHLDLYG